MCTYSYIYYSNCRHGELTCHVRCDRAIALRQVEEDRSDRDPPAGDAQDPQGSGGRSDDPPSSSRDINSSQGPASQQASSSQTMSTATPGHGLATLGWAQSIPTDVADPIDGADFIPRSIQDDSDTEVSFAPASGYQPHHIGHLMPTEDTQQDGKVKEIIDRFESFCNSEDRGGLLANDMFVCVADTLQAPELDDTQSSQQPAVHTAPHVSATVDAQGSLDIHTPEETKTEDKNKAADQSSDQQDADLESYSSRKPIPTHWGPPKLATADRARKRESRKQPEQAKLLLESGTKTVRGVRSKVDLRSRVSEPSFLTKGSSAPLDSNLTSPLSPRSPTKPRHSASKSTLSSPAVSPLHRAAGQQSHVKTTPSPPKLPVFSAAGHGDAPERARGAVSHERALSTTSTVKPFVTAPSSPEGSFHTPPEQFDYDVPALDLADAGLGEQLASAMSGMKPSPFHSRGKSDPHPHLRLPAVVGKATLSRPAVPKLSLKIPPLGLVPTNRSPTLSGGTSSAGSPTLGLSASSKIPRASAIVKAENSGLRRSPSTKTLGASQADTSRPRPAEGTTSKRFSDPRGMSILIIEPHEVPLPNTPVAIPLVPICSATINQEPASSPFETEGAAEAPKSANASQVDSGNASSFRRVSAPTDFDSFISDLLSKTAQAAGTAGPLTSEEIPTRTSPAGSNVTITAAPVTEDVIQQDSAVVSSRRASHQMASGPSTAPVDETSPIATFASELRATAPAFVPSQTALPTALPTEWASAGPSTNDPNSSAPTLSPYHMIQSPLDLPPYAVAFGWNMPGGYNFSTLPPPPGISATLPARHGKKKHWVTGFRPRGRRPKNRSESPTKTTIAGAPLASPTALSSSNAGPQGVSSAYETSHEASPPVSPTGAAPFQAQLDLIASASTATVQPATKQTTTTQQPTAPTSPPRRSYGRGATIINTDYTVNHPTPTEYQSSIPFFMQRIPFPPPPARTHPRTSIPFIHPPSHRPYRQNGPAGNALSGNSVYDINARIRGPAFMPLEFTRPFPSPVVPAAMRGEGEEGGSGEYVGYAVEDGEVVRRETCCGEMRVEAAMEYGGGWCHGCVP